MKIIKTTILCIAFSCIIFTGGCATTGGAKKVKFDNGLEAVLKSDKNSLAASVCVYIRAGAVDEKPSQSGLSHFLEHLMFKGSENYPGDLMSRNVENMGGYINAATSKEYTMYYINIQKDGVEETVKMLADTLNKPLFPQDEIDRERKVVIEEIQRHSDNPYSVLFDNFFEAVYQESAMKNSIIGSSDVIANVTRDEIYDYYGAHYVPEKMKVLVIGNFDEKKIENLVAETFGKFEKKTAPEDPNLMETAKPKEDIIKKGNVELGYMLSGFVGPDINSDDVFTADLASIVLGGGKSSRLYRVLKEQKQLVYSIDSSFMTSKGSGLSFVRAVFDPKNLEEIKIEIAKQIDDIINNGITEEELKRAKLGIKTGWNFSMETPFDIAYHYGFWTVLGRPDAMDEYVPKIEALSAEDVQNYFAKYYSHDKIITAAYLPKAEK